jgi:hypothetical protein
MATAIATTFARRRLAISSGSAGSSRRASSRRSVHHVTTAGARATRMVKTIAPMDVPPSEGIGII